MPNLNPNQTGLSQRWATDTTGPTRLKSFRIETDMLDWLESLAGSQAMGMHVRAALRDYRKKIEPN